MNSYFHYFGMAPLARLPLPLGYGLASGIGIANRYGRQTDANFVAAQMAKVFPALPPRARGAAVREYFALQAREHLDVFTLPRWRLGHTLTLEESSLAVLAAAKAANRGVIIVMGHFGRVNLLLLALALAGERLGMLTMNIDETNPDLDAVARRFFHRKVYGLLDKIGGPLITLNDDKRLIYRALEGGATLVMLVDAITSDYGKQRKMAVNFGDGVLHLPTGIARIARSTGAKLVYGSIPERGWGGVAQLRALDDDAETALQQAMAYLAAAVEARPGQWWQWGQLDLCWCQANAGKLL